MNKLIFLILFVLVSVTADAQRFRSKEYIPKYKFDFELSNFQYRFVLTDYIDRDVPLYCQRFQLIIGFGDKTKPILIDNSIWEDDQPPDVTYFIATKKQTKKLAKEIGKKNIQFFELKNTRTRKIVAIK